MRTDKERLIDFAFSQYGIKELPGTEANNPEILKYFTGIGKTWVKTDETAWCAASMNWILKGIGYEYSGELDARSFLTVGENVVVPEFFDIVVFWRESKDSWKGHVGFFINFINEDYINVLGGNQSNQFKISPYPLNGKKVGLLEYRRPKLRRVL